MKKSVFTATALRKPVQVLIAVLLLFLLLSHHLTILMIIITGSALGIVLGKVFCRWMCPMGFIMELLSGAVGDEKARSLYQYHKLGCPVAWAGGALNRVSLFTIGHRIAGECKACGLCDKACYVSTMNEKYSLYRKDRKNPADSYTCSRCLACVDSCPTHRLAFQLRKTAG